MPQDQAAPAGVEIVVDLLTAMMRSIEERLAPPPPPPSLLARLRRVLSGKALADQAGRAVSAMLRAKLGLIASGLAASVAADLDAGAGDGPALPDLDDDDDYDFDEDADADHYDDGDDEDDAESATAAWSALAVIEATEAGALDAAKLGLIASGLAASVAADLDAGAGDGPALPDLDDDDDYDFDEDADADHYDDGDDEDDAESATSRLECAGGHRGYRGRRARCRNGRTARHARGRRRLVDRDRRRGRYGAMQAGCFGARSRCKGGRAGRFGSGCASGCWSARRSGAADGRAGAQPNSVGVAHGECVARRARLRSSNPGRRIARRDLHSIPYLARAAGEARAGSRRASALPTGQMAGGARAGWSIPKRFSCRVSTTWPNDDHFVA